MVVPWASMPTASMHASGPRPPVSSRSAVCTSPTSALTPRVTDFVPPGTRSRIAPKVRLMLGSAPKKPPEFRSASVAEKKIPLIASQIAPIT